LESADGAVFIAYLVEWMLMMNFWVLGFIFFGKWSNAALNFDIEKEKEREREREDVQW